MGFSVYTSTTFTLAVFCQAGFLSVWFLSSLGMVLYWNGLFIRVINDEHDVDIDIPGWFALEFAGAFIALLFWVYSLCMHSYLHMRCIIDVSLDHIGDDVATL